MLNLNVIRLKATKQLLTVLKRNVLVEGMQDVAQVRCTVRGWD